MVRISVAELVAATEGRLVFADDAERRQIVEGLAWDSRKIRAGNIFLAMPGERVDGNDFVTKAVTAGAGAVLATREPSDAVKAVAGEFACPIVVVDDGVLALTKLAAYWRSRLHAIVIGVTGSSGKTSTKDLLRSVVSQRFKTVATVANYNNEIGCPATILSADEDTEVLVLEMGMTGLKEIESLCALARPSIGVITNIGVSHMELLGSRENIALAKSELLSGLPQTGFAVVNADDPYTPLVKEFAKVDARHLPCCSYGLNDSADVYATDISFDSEAHARFTMRLPGVLATTVYLPMPGRHNVSNALAAAAVGRYLGLSLEQIVAGLEGAAISGMRMERVDSAKGVRFYNDAYNANPDSMCASLDTFSSMECAGRRIAVLGDMGELGPTERELHREVGEHAATTAIDLLVCVGTLAKEIAAGARAAGFEDTAIIEFGSVEQAAQALKGYIAEGDIMLVKASRFMGLERIVREIA